MIVLPRGVPLYKMFLLTGFRCGQSPQWTGFTVLRKANILARDVMMFRMFFDSCQKSEVRNGGKANKTYGRNVPNSISWLF
jgi:hypothetical protein